jgi:hypothetical protein
MIPTVIPMAIVMVRSHRKVGPMSNAENRPDGPRIRTAPLLTSAALVGAGTLVALAGLAVAATHLASATSQWIDEMEVPPSELARQKWAQVRTAAKAGAAAWQNGSGTQPVLSVPATD